MRLVGADQSCTPWGPNTSFLQAQTILRWITLKIMPLVEERCFIKKIVYSIFATLLTVERFEGTVCCDKEWMIATAAPSCCTCGWIICSTGFLPFFFLFISERSLWDEGVHIQGRISFFTEMFLETAPQPCSGQSPISRQLKILSKLGVRIHHHTFSYRRVVLHCLEQQKVTKMWMSGHLALFGKPLRTSPSSRLHLCGCGEGNFCFCLVLYLS